MDKMQELINELNEASKLYYNGQESFLSDKEFDEKINELKALEQKYKVIYANSPTVKVGAPVLNALNKVTIKDKPMLSLDKVHSAEEIKKFSDGYDIIASIKCDGLSVRLIYENTDLVSANTRGDGYIGGDITEHIKHFLNVPLKIATPERFIIDGEAIIYDDDFTIVNKNGEFKNNRNTASGSLALLDMSVVADRRLSFIAWNIIAGSDKKCYHHNLEYAKELGFTTVPALALDCTKVEENEINEINRILLEEAKEKGIPCDGVVWKINDIAAGAEKGQTSHHFLDAVAWKPEIEEYDINNTYHPYGDLVVSKEVTDVTEVSKDTIFPFTFSFTVKEDEGEEAESVPVTKKFDYKILEGEDNEISSGQVGDGDTLEIKGGQRIEVYEIDEYVNYKVTEGDLPGRVVPELGLVVILGCHG